MTDLEAFELKCGFSDTCLLVTLSCWKGSCPGWLQMLCSLQVAGFPSLEVALMMWFDQYHF